VKNVSKYFFSETTWTIETKLPMNDHLKVLYKVSVFYADRKSKMAATAGHRLTLDPIFENVRMPSSQKLQIRLNPTRQECSLDGPLQSLGFLFRYKMEDGDYSRT
jgi:hypothetical protein